VSYGDDDWTKRAETRLCETFECDLRAFLVVTGTAANSLALSAMAPPYGAVLCHAESHIMVDECGAPELFTGGAKLIGLDEPGGKITARAIERKLDGFIRNVHDAKPAAISITQASEAGTVYTKPEIEAISEIARHRALRLHMDGARFANALVSLACTPAELTWKAGVDALSFGATKNGAMALEAVVFFDPALAEDFGHRRMRAGQLLSKSRFLGAQMLAYLDNDLWLDNARHANAMARRLVAGLTPLKGTQLMYPVDANEIFIVMPAHMHDALQDGGAKYHPWPSDRPGERAFRLVTAFDTDPADVDRFLSIAKSA
jgi:threonine aldolase